MAGPGICVLCLADTCTSEMHPVFNPVAPYGYLLSDMYLFMADITNSDSFVKSFFVFFIGRILFRKNPTKKYSVEIIYMIMTKIRRYKIINNLK